MIWLELRQSLPLVTFGLLLAFLVAVASVVMEPQPNYSATEYLRSAMLHSISFVGMLWAAVVGSGLYSAELGSGLGAFWRSRPISSGMWFWCKFIVGLVAVLAVLDGVTILACWNAPRDLPTAGVSWAYVACFPVLHAFLYAMSVLGTCWLRKPVIGAFLALFGFAVLTVVLEAVPATASLETANVYNKLLKAERAGSVDFTQCGYPLVYGTMAASTFLMAFISARLAKPLQPTCRWFTSLSA